MDVQKKATTIKKDRELWLDALRGIATVLVVLGHIANGNILSATWGADNTLMNSIYNFTYAFHMPFMFVISGYSFSMAYVREGQVRTAGVKKQMINLLWNYVVWSVFMVVTKVIFAGAVNRKQSLSNIWKIGYKSVELYWYLYVLLVLYLVAMAVVKWKMEWSMKWKLVLSVSAVLCLGYPLLSGVAKELTIKMVLLYLFFFVLGMWLQQKKEPLKDWLLTITGSLGAVYLGYVIYLAVEGTKLKGNVSLPVLSAVGAFCISITCLELAPKMLKRARICSLIGRYSLEIYVTHCFITAANRKLLPLLGIDGPVLHTVVTCMMAVYLPMFCAYVLKRMGIHEVIFRPYSFYLRRRKK